MVFHSPQAGQRPKNWGYSLPQLLQYQTVFVFAINMFCFCQMRGISPNKYKEKEGIEIKKTDAWRRFIFRCLA